MYVLDMLEETGMNHARHADNPLAAGLKLYPNVGQLLEDQGKYRKIICKLIY